MSRKDRETRIIGSDISVDHGATVSLDLSGVPRDVWWYSNKAGDVAQKIKSIGASQPHRIPVKRKDEDRDAFITRRMMDIAVAFESFFQPIADEYIIYCCLEGYAYGAVGKAYQIGEAGGLFKFYAKLSDASLRIYDPDTIKIFATGRAKAEKEDVEKAATEAALEAGLDIAALPARVRSDVADAFCTAWIALAELRIRSGEWELIDLPENIRKIFLRVTKSNPVGVLSRPWS